MSTPEVAARTGEAEELTHFRIPEGANPILRLILGFETFDENQEALLSLKAATGTKGAPRVFSLKLVCITRASLLHFKPISRDAELEVSHDSNGELQLLFGKLVGVIKHKGGRNSSHGLRITQKR